MPTFQLAATESDFCPATVHRAQLPLTNAVAFTAYSLQGSTLPSVSLDFAKPPPMTSDDFWMHLYVLLSRVATLDDHLLMRSVIDGGPPAGLRAEFIRLEDLERRTLLDIDSRV